MFKKIFISFIFILFAPLALANHPYSEIEKWLAKMHHAAHMINYDGTFVYGQNNELSSMKIIHSVSDKGEFERLISMDGSGREVIRTGDTVTCILPDKKSVVVDKSKPNSEFPPQFPLKIEQLTSIYDFHLSGEAKVAGRPAQILVIKPKDNYRYGHKLWIDAKTGLLLKSHLVDMDGTMVEQFMFTEIEYPKIIDKERFDSNVNEKAFVWYKAKEDAATDDENTTSKSMNWKVSDIPKGFVPGVQRHHKMTISEMPVEHLMFSDGLSSLSVFVEEEMEDSKNLIGSSTMGAVNAYGRKVGNYHVTVVGDVPTTTVKMVGNSVKQLKH